PLHGRSSVRNPSDMRKSRWRSGPAGMRRTSGPGPPRLRNMSNVVEMKTSARRKRQSKTALVLGGGGFTGGVYQIGALRALDLLSVNRSVNQFDVYVGTSAGSLIASLVANGVTPEQMMRTINDQVPHALPPL